LPKQPSVSVPRRNRSSHWTQPSRAASPCSKRVENQHRHLMITTARTTTSKSHSLLRGDTFEVTLQCNHGVI
jgi:hypothetical protein